MYPVFHDDLGLFSTLLSGMIPNKPSTVSLLTTSPLSALLSEELAFLDANVPSDLLEILEREKIVDQMLAPLKIFSKILHSDQ